MWSISAPGSPAAGRALGRCSCASSSSTVQVQALVGRGLAQADLPAAAEVQLQAAKDGGGAGQLHGNLAQGLLGAQRCRDSVFQSGIHLDVPFAWRAAIIK